MAEPDDLPPLEDFSSVLNKLGSLKKNEATSISSDTPAVSEATEAVKPKSSTFGGLKKGFLTKKPVESTHASIDKNSDGPVEITSNPSKQGASFQLGEMKRAVDESIEESVPAPLLPENWLTDQLLEKVQTNPLLSQAFEHPDFSQVLTRFTQNPKQALREYGDTPEFRAFFHEMCSLLGNHFTQLADERGEGEGQEGTPELDEEDRKMKEILDKEEVQEVMKDQRIRGLIMDMRDDPKRAQDTFAAASPELRRKINVLIKHNIIGIQQQYVGEHLQMFNQLSKFHSSTNTSSEMEFNVAPFLKILMWKEETDPAPVPAVN